MNFEKRHTRIEKRGTLNVPLIQKLYRIKIHYKNLHS